MRPLLLTADLHYTPKYQRWLLEHAAEFQGIAIAGDLCDLFLANEVISDEVLVRRGRTRETSSPVSLRLQRLRLEEWMAQVAGISPLIVSTGNHDCGLWQSKSPGLHGDLTICETENFVLASCPWMAGGANRIEALLSATAEVVADAEKLARKTGKPLFLLHHEPPSRDTLNGKHISDLLRQFRPPLLGCGHLHQHPYLSGWFSKVHQTHCFNAGNSEAITGDEFSAPNHCLIFPPDDQGESLVEWHHLSMNDKGNFTWETASTTVSTK